MKKGFTLIELLIVIGILAILATATILVLNPAQLFAQARDSQRISDLSSLKSAIAFYLSTASTPSMEGTSTCASSYWASRGGVATDFAGGMTQSPNTGLLVDGSGWVPVVFSGASGGSPLSALPKDPTNDATYNYQYACDNSARTFEVDGKMESDRYSSGSTNVQNADGGDQAAVYEVGNDPGLNL